MWSLNERRSWHKKKEYRGYRCLTSDDARRKIYPNRRSPYVPCFANIDFSSNRKQP